MRVFGVFLLAILAFSGADKSEDCPPCEWNDCEEPPSDCKSYTTGHCDCCHVCEKIEGEACGGGKFEIGKCRDGLVCEEGKPGSDNQEGTCVCPEQPGYVCGSDDRDYLSVCDLRLHNEKLQAQGKPGDIEVKNQGACQRAPTITVTNTNTTVEELSGAANLYLSCKAQGVPIPKITWFHKGEELPGENDNVQIQMVRGRLPNEMNGYMVFLSLRPVDSGDYTCTGKNKHGEASEVIKLTVKPNVKDKTEL